jgi:hypothetical protein
MKKLFITILAVFYLGVSSGATVHFHYCMGELINWGLEQDKSTDCSNCGMDKTKADGCCKEQHKEIKVDKSHQAFKTAFHFQQTIQAVLISHLHKNWEEALPISLIVEYPVTNGPPRPATPIFIKNCTYRI